MRPGYRCLLLGLLLSVAARATPSPGDPPPPVRPTATAQTGDTGGTFFGEKPDPKKIRRYFVAAEAIPWDFAPSGRDEVCGLPLPRELYAENRARPKLRYLQYTDATFRTRVLPDLALGILGPALRGVVGEFLVVTFFNRTDRPLSMHPHGVRYDKHSEGAYYRPGPGRGAAVAPGAQFTYVWQLDEDSGPRPDEPSSKGWLYHSHVRGDTETNLGLMGAIIVTDPKRARPDGTPIDIDREFATLFMIFDESDLDPLLAVGPPTASAAPPASPPTWAQTQERLEQGERYAINGRAYGNLPGLDMNEGERTRWYLFALGSEHDFHTAHWHGLRVIEEGRRRTDVVDLLPATMKTADLLADNPGSWLYHCHVAEHMNGGMFARFTIYSRDTVGVSRADVDRFLGHADAQRSIRIDRAETILNLASLPARAEIVFDGVLSAPDQFRVSGRSVRVKFAGDETVFQLNVQGVGKAPRAMLRIHNTELDGHARGGRLDFQLYYNNSTDLLNALPPAQPGANRVAELWIEIGEATHHIRVPLKHRTKE